MISWLKGKTLQNWQLANKKGIVLNVNGVGYEIQLLSTEITSIDNSIIKEFWIHQINREDYTNLYGFKDVNQRDLFRKIVSVSGIGPQIGMSLLENLGVSQFVESIEENNVNQLMKAPGVGKRIAERLIIELKNKLEKLNDNKDKEIENKRINKSKNVSKFLEEIKSILTSLGYMDYEINESIELIKTNEYEEEILGSFISTDAKKELMDKYLKKILMRLSQNST